MLTLLRPCLTLVAISLFVLFEKTPAADWPQWHGPDRTNRSKETGLLKNFRQDGPKLAWLSEELGLGYSGPAVAQGVLYILGTDPKANNRENVFAIDTRTGNILWKTPIADFLDNNWGGGPRSTPTIDSNLLYALSANGELVCLNTKTGEKIWGVSFTRDFGGEIPSWGYCESPLVDGNALIVTPGGKKGTMAALNKMTGKVIWQGGGNERAAYSSAIIAQLDGLKFYVQMVPSGVIGVRADDGKLLFKSDIGANGVAVIPTPIYHDGYVFATSGYKSGCGLLKLKKNASGGIDAEKVYANKNMINHHGGVILLSGHIYGYTDGDRGNWTCLDLMTGKNLWKNRDLDKGSLTYADGAFWCYGERSGRLVCIEAAPSQWKVLGEFKLPKQTKIRKPAGGIWTHPVIADGKLYLRDQDLLFCFDLKAQ